MAQQETKEEKNRTKNDGRTTKESIATEKDSSLVSTTTIFTGQQLKEKVAEAFGISDVYGFDQEEDEEVETYESQSLKPKTKLGVGAKERTRSNSVAEKEQSLLRPNRIKSKKAGDEEEITKELSVWSSENEDEEELQRFRTTKRKKRPLVNQLLETMRQANEDKSNPTFKDQVKDIRTNKRSKKGRPRES